MEDYQRLVQQEIARNKQQELEEQNYNTVQAKLIEEYGPNYASTLKQQISSLKLTPDFVNDLARKHPQVLSEPLDLTVNVGVKFSSSASIDEQK